MPLVLSNAQTVSPSLQLEAAAWNSILRSLRASGMSVPQFVEETSPMVGGVQVEAHQIYRALERQKKAGDKYNYDRRHDCSGRRPKEIPWVILRILLRDEICFRKTRTRRRNTITGRRKLLIEELRTTHRWTDADLEGIGVPSYGRIRRVLNNLPEYFRVYLEKGYKALHEQMEPSGRATLFEVGECWAMDTSVITDYSFRFGDKTLVPHVSAILDEGSTFCPGARLHWKTATHREVVRLIQEALLPNRGKPPSDLWPQRGSPRYFKKDNGTLGKNQWISRVCDKLQITEIHSPPNKPQANAVIENFFGHFKTEFVPFLRKRMREKQFVAVGRPSDKYALFVRRFRELVEEYNQTPKDELGGLSPLEFYELHRPPVPVNERSQAEIVEATQISQERKLTNGRFSYGGELYKLPKGTLIGTHDAVIWVDPVDPLPPRIPVEVNGTCLGDATYAPNRAARQLDLPQRSVREAAKVVEQVEKAVGAPKTPKQAPKNSQEAKSSTNSTGRKTRTRKGKATTASKPEVGSKENEPKFEIPAGPIEFPDWAENVQQAA